ncbi:hypothetical protein FHW71_000788 [Enterobacter sp. Sphag1F]|jgi:hypothetical protein|nr:hypothetical protein [Enterobacter sp. Sphag1F]NYI12611.1 hypothetical protein [Enterobacter sp. Sphag71]
MNGDPTVMLRIDARRYEYGDGAIFRRVRIHAHRDDITPDDAYEPYS